MAEINKASALKEVIGNDCCNTGRNYPSVTLREIKEFKETCSPEEYEKLAHQAVDHLNTHES